VHHSYSDAKTALRLETISINAIGRFVERPLLNGLSQSKQPPPSRLDITDINSKLRFFLQGN